ncbi:hypothetical protein RND81_09G062200 [Saponaria officinalis]|uniref:Uncharacterized protein n=1 Tax=Saponaria officinalis TaxID=3572 RepID=A0AAW1IHD3_SAPOF
MKASLKFREEQKPLFKSKVPISILGLPFQSGLIAGDSKELSLSLATFFEYGPSFRVSYRPNDAFNPFSLTIKSGIGQFGSPFNAPMTMSAEFNFLGSNTFNINDRNSINPRFMIHFKPNFGDFCVKKLQSSVISDFSGKTKPQFRGIYEEDDGELIESQEYKITSLPLRKTVESAVVGMEVGANTSLPIRNGAVLRFRWGVKFPAEGLRNWFKDPTGKMLPRGVPLLVLNKIGIEHVAKVDKKEAASSNGVTTRGSEGAELADACFGMKREVEMLRFENAGLGIALDELRAEFSRGRGGGGKGDERMLVKSDRNDDGEINV